jgi:sugar lactone lactonase YvrE
MPARNVELVDPAAAVTGEGPAWDASAGQLVWVDMPVGLVHLADADGARLRSYELGFDVGAALPAAEGGWLLAMENGFARLQPDGSVTPLLALLAQEPQFRMNDAKCDPVGRAFAGVMAFDRSSGTGRLVRLDPGPATSTAVTGLTVPNGLGWSPAGDVFYHIDSRGRVVHRYPYAAETGVLGQPGTPLIEYVACDGLPDGLSVDDAGCLWIAVWGVGEVRRYTPEGALDLTLPLPVPYPTSCAFGGPGGRRLFITTSSRLGGPPGLAGGLFAVDLDVSGRPAVPWRP